MRALARPLLLLALAHLPGAGPAGADDAGFGLDTLEIVSGGATHRFEVEVARTAAQQRLGLMHRTHLAPDAGMLFLYTPEQRIRMWMKDTFVPLDMLFLGEDGAIVSIAERTVPLSLAPIGPDVYVSGVLEVLSGTAERLDLRLGDRVRHPHFEKRDGGG